MADGSIGCASKTVNSRQQMNILDQSKTATEAAAQLIVTAKEAGGNPKVSFLQSISQSDKRYPGTFVHALAQMHIHRDRDRQTETHTCTQRERGGGRFVCYK